MKTLLPIFFALVSLTSCSKFLDEVDKDKLIPSDAEHYAAVLLNEFSNEQAMFRGIDMMTDNVTEYEYATESSRRTLKPIYTWQLEIELDENGNRISNNTAWESMYKDIAVANYTIEFIDGATGTKPDKDYVKAEAYFVRAYSYFELANLYGVPYHAASAATDLGVPLRLDNAIEKTYDRANLQDTYYQVLADLTSARELITSSGVTKTKFHPSVVACDLLLSRVYLYMQNWEMADFYASKVIDVLPLSKMVTSGPYVIATRSDIIYSSQVLIGQSDASMFDAGWEVNNRLIDMYHPDDLRLAAFFDKIGGRFGKVYYPKKRTISFSSMGYNNLRVAEAYLNRAEARCHLNKDAAADLRTLLESRYKNTASISIATGQALLDQILTERRKEFCFEGSHRWFDLRRMENRPVIYHYFTRTDANGNKVGLQRYTLWSDDRNYTLPIPLTERENNPLIRNNERLDKIPENL